MEKRDWFAGAISDLLVATQGADVDYLEEFLLQVMNDEFDVNVEGVSKFKAFYGIHHGTVAVQVTRPIEK